MERDAILSKYMASTTSIKIEPTNRCNSDCVFCAYGSMQRKKEVLDQALFQAVVPELKPNGIGLVILSPVVGEVLLDPLFKQRVELLHQHGLKILTFSNIFVLHKFKMGDVASLLEKMNTLHVSIAPNSEAHTALFRKGTYANIVAGLRMLAEISSGCSCSITIKIRAYPPNNALDSEVAQSLAHSALHVDRQEYPYKNWGGAVSTLPETMRLLQHDPKRGPLPCRIAQRPVIFASGKVGLCPCSDYDASMVLGDLREKDLFSIIKSPEREAMVASFFTRTEPPHCRNCTFYIPFDGRDY